MSELGSLRCPFCGGNNISAGEVLGERPGGQKYKQNMCRSCGALGPETKRGSVTDEASTSSWNMRTTPTETGGT